MNKYKEKISNILNGRTLNKELQERRDWEGPSALLHSYEEASNEGRRSEFIEGIKQVIADNSEEEGVRAVRHFSFPIVAMPLFSSGRDFQAVCIAL